MYTKKRKGVCVLPDFVKRKSDHVHQPTHMTATKEKEKKKKKRKSLHKKGRSSGEVNGCISCFIGPLKKKKFKSATTVIKF